MPLAANLWSEVCATDSLLQMTSTRIIYFVIASTSIGALSSCDTFPQVKSNIRWNSSTADQACVRKAIESTPGIKFDHQETQTIDSTCLAGDCDKKVFTTFYTVLANKTYPGAYVQCYEKRSGKIEVKNYGSGAINHSLPEEDGSGFKAAIFSLNSQIQKFCPSAGEASPPK